MYLLLSNDVKFMLESESSSALKNRCKLWSLFQIP